MEIKTKYNIGEKVLIEKPHVGIYLKPKPTEFTVSGFVIHSNGKGYKVYYTMKEDRNKPKKRYLESEIKKVDTRIKTADLEKLADMLLAFEYLSNVIPITEEQGNKVLEILTNKTNEHYRLTQNRNVESDDITYDLSIWNDNEKNEFVEEEWLNYTR